MCNRCELGEFFFPLLKQKAELRAGCVCEEYAAEGRRGNGEKVIEIACKKEMFRPTPNRLAVWT